MTAATFLLNNNEFPRAIGKSLAQRAVISSSVGVVGSHGQTFLDFPHNDLLASSHHDPINSNHSVQPPFKVHALLLLLLKFVRVVFQRLLRSGELMFQLNYLSFVLFLKFVELHGVWSAGLSLSAGLALKAVYAVIELF